MLYRRFLAIVTTSACAWAGGLAACAEGNVDFTAAAAGPSSSTTGTGGAAGSGGAPSLCAADCSAINTPACLKSVCNDGMYTGTIGECVIVPDEGASCDDGQFCTIEDTCDDKAKCVGGPANDCGMTPGQCKEIACDEDTDACIEVGSMDGAPCVDPANLCMKGKTCSSGNCIGGQLDDCFFFPVSDDCHVAVCNPANGVCEEQIGNEGDPCTDLQNLCTIGKTCVGGVCDGGSPKDCSSLTVGCFNGVCDMANGMCFQQPIMPGGQCAEATDQCNVGICDMVGNCNATPANQGMACNDGSACTGGETCNNGTCAGGTPITACSTGDLCCPPSCTISNDADCNTSCLALFQNNPSAPDGVYQIYENMMPVDVFCDMTHGGVTYRELAFGMHLSSYTGYTMISVADLQDPVIQQAFIFLYNEQGGALNNIDNLFSSGNCCIKLSEHITQNQFLQLGSTYIYPADLANVSSCLTNYPDPQYRFWFALNATASPSVLPSNFFQLNPAGTSTACSNSNNPAWFWRKF